MTLAPDRTDPTPPRPTSLAALNAAAIVILALYFGRDLLVPLVLSVLLAFVLAPIVVLLQRARLGRAPSVLLAVTLAFVAIIGMGVIVGRELTDLAQSLPTYQDTIQEKVKSLTIGGEAVTRLLDGLRSMLGGGPSETHLTVMPPALKAAPASPAAAAATPGLDAASAFSLLRTVVAPLFGPLATAGVVAVFAIFVLMAREDLRDRLVRLLGREDLHRSILALNDAASRLSRYFLFQLLLNASFGVFVTAGLWLAGLPSPALWGILAGTMRFVPFIGTAIAVIPPVLLAVVVAPGWSLTFIVLGLFILTDVIVSQIVEPLLYGHSTGLSPIAVIVSAAFWAFLWGPVGLLLATPLTVCLVVVGRYIEPLAFIEVILGDRPPLEPAETFYQRALEGDGRELLAQARRCIAATSLADYYDKVAMLGLALAQTDLARDALEFERLDRIHAQIEALLGQLAASLPRAPHEQNAQPPDWSRPGAVLCIPGRGQLDGLAATMAVQVMQDAGFGASPVANAALDDSADKTGFPQVAMCCLSVLDKGSTASGVRYLLRRIQRQMPGATIVVCLWHAEAGSTLLQTLRAEGEDETITLSLGELVALAKAQAARDPVTTS